MPKFLLTIFLSVFYFFGFGQPGVKPYDAVLTGYEYPYAVRHIKVSVQGYPLQMAYMDVKPASENGKVVLLLHGKNFCGAYWGRVAGELVKEGYRVVMPDQVGFGKSSKPEHIQYTFQLLASLTHDLLDSLGVGKVSVVGHSMGGMLATRFALMYPGQTEKLILEDPIGLEDWKMKVPYQSIEKWFAGEMSQSYEKIRQYQSENYYHNEWKPEYDQWATLQAGWTVGPDKKQVAWNAALTYDMIFTQPVVYEFDSIKASTLLVIGQLDRTALGKNLVPDSIKKTLGKYPLLGRLTASRIKRCKLVEIPGVGHIPHIEDYEKFITPLLIFLRDGQI